MKIGLNNDVVKSQGFYAGIYEKWIDMNGKPTYKKQDKAIWYSIDYQVWTIGKIDDLGTTAGFIVSTSQFAKLTDHGKLTFIFSQILSTKSS